MPEIQERIIDTDRTENWIAEKSQAAKAEGETFAYCLAAGPNSRTAAWYCRLAEGESVPAGFTVA